LGGPAAHTLEGAAPLQTTQQQKGAPLRGGQRAFARIQREGASAPPAPSPRKYKNKNLAGDGGVGPAFMPECRAVRDRTERPQDEPGAMPPAPVYPKCAYGHSATGTRVLNPAFHFVSGCVCSAPRTSPARAFFRASIDVRVPRTFARQFPARSCIFSARIGCTCARTYRTCGLFPHSEERNSRAAPYVHCRSFTRVHQNGALIWLDVSHRPPNAEPKILFFPATVRHILTRFSVPLRRRTTTRKTCLSMV